MLLFRVLIFGLLALSAVSFAFYIGTGDPRYRLWGLKLLKWMLVAGLSFFAVLVLERVA
jgi:hypothetical protein